MAWTIYVDNEFGGEHEDKFIAIGMAAVAHITHPGAVVEMRDENGDWYLRYTAEGKRKWNRTEQRDVIASHLIRRAFDRE